MSLSQKKWWKPKPLHYLHCVSDELVCLGSWADPFFLQTLAFPSLWSIKSVHKTLSQNFWGLSPILLANEWFASSDVASVLSLQLSQCFCRQLLMFSLIYPFEVCYLVHQWFLSSSGDFKWLYLLLPVFLQWFDWFFIFSQLHNCSFFTHRHLSGFHVGYTSN